MTTSRPGGIEQHEIDQYAAKLRDDGPNGRFVLEVAITALEGQRDAFARNLPACRVFTRAELLSLLDAGIEAHRAVLAEIPPS